MSTIEQVQTGNTQSCWQVSGTPSIGFYRKLHAYLKSLPNLSNVVIGKLYSAVDPNFKEKGSRPDNLYRFVQNVVTSKRESSDPMVYSIFPVKSTSTTLQECLQQIEELKSECTDLREKVEASRAEFNAIKYRLHDVTNERECLKKRAELSRARVKKLKGKNEQLEAHCAQVEMENLELQSEEEPCSSDSDTNSETCDDAESTLQSIIGHHKFSPELRKLYYRLLADQVPVSKIASIIQSVLKCFNPSIDVEKLRLPKKTCVSYMRKEELKTICDSHKANIICSDARKGKGIFLNTDGTTKLQKKLYGIVANDMVIGVNEVPDGRAVSAVNEISREFEKLRRIAEMLGLPNATSINWTLVKSSSSDSAASQKYFNKLVEEKRQEDEVKFGPAVCTQDTLDLVKTFCSLHLGVNLRKAFLSGTTETEQDEQHHVHMVDTFVYEFCKLFGKTGVPEYACGSLAFPDFLNLKLSTCSTESKQHAYYLACTKVKLNRQVGNRYFVSAANAAKILFLKEAAIEFLEFTGKDRTGNKLERDVFTKLHDYSELAQLQADSLMYYHIYADVLMLSKSTDLDLSVLSMNQHYLELDTFLSEIVETNAAIVFNPEHSVFKSEERLYGTDAKVNHRLKSDSHVYRKLFAKIETGCEQLLIRGAIQMRQKLVSYAKEQLPGGCYWDPDEAVKKILQNIKPSNDVCESILGHNDYLTTAVPNLHQITRSNLVQVKRNETLKWLSSLPDDEQSEIVDLAVKQRRFVTRECNEDIKSRAELRQQRMLQENAKRLAKELKVREQREKLCQCHLITSSDELIEELLAIEKEATSVGQRKNKKVQLLKTQIQIRRKVLCQTVPIVFTNHRKQRPVQDIVKELCDFLDQNTVPTEFECFVKNPTSLVGRNVKHRFLDETANTLTWYTGTVVEYSCQDKTHCLKYDGESEYCHFDLIIDMILGDLIIL